MTERRSWEEVKRQRGVDPAVRAGYETASVAFRLAEQVRAMRQEKEMTQQDLARVMGTTQSAIARLEAGGIEPSIATLLRLADALGVNLVVELQAKGKSKAQRTKRASGADLKRAIEATTIEKKSSTKGRKVAVKGRTQRAKGA